MRLRNILGLIMFCAVHTLVSVRCIQRAADGTEYGETLRAKRLMLVMRQRCPNVDHVKGLLSRDNVNSYIILKSGGKCTLLYLAVSRDDPRRAEELTKLCLNNGAQVDGKTPESPNCSPLLQASDIRHENVVDLLLEHNADTEMRRFGRRTPLQGECSEYNARCIAEQLTLAGADMNAECEKGEKPIHRSVAENAKDVTEFFLSVGSSPYVRDWYGYTPEEIFGYRDEDIMTINAISSRVPGFMLDLLQGTIPALTQNVVSKSMLDNSNENDKVRYATLCLGQECYNNATAIVKRITDETALGRVLLHAHKLRLMHQNRSKTLYKQYHRNEISRSGYNERAEELQRKSEGVRNWIGSYIALYPHSWDDKLIA